MKRFSAPSTVIDAEQRLEQSRQRLQRQWDHVQSTLQSTLTRPSNLFIVTGISAVLGMWLARRKTSTVNVSAASKGFPIRGLMFTLLARFILQRIEKRLRTTVSTREP